MITAFSHLFRLARAGFVFSREGVELLQIAGLTGQVNWNDGRGAVGDSAGCIFGIDIHRERIDIYEYRTGARINDGFRGCREGRSGQ